MTDLNNDHAHAPHFLQPRFGNLISIEVRQRHEPEFTERWMVADAYNDAEEATEEETIAYLCERDIRNDVVDIHDAEAWSDFNDLALAA